MAPIACFNSLEGQWELDRSILGYGTVTGTATFHKLTSTPPTLRYREEGLFRSIEGNSFKIFQDYLYCFQEEKISVFFDETPERLMHTLKFDTPDLTIATATHVCDHDAYKATYTFDLPAAFSLRYSIKGPQKDYSILTVFKRSIQS